MNNFHQAVARYRECSRHVRNAYFQPPKGAPDAWEQTEGWIEVHRLLFNWIVLYPHGLKPAEPGQPHSQVCPTTYNIGMGTRSDIQCIADPYAGTWRTIVPKSRSDKYPRSPFRANHTANRIRNLGSEEEMMKLFLTHRIIYSTLQLLCQNQFH
jgi:hypothetical protein